jgi:zinc protease
VNRRYCTVSAIALLASLILSSTITAQQQGLDPNQTLPVDPQVTVGTLENGLTYFIRTNQRPENRAEFRLVVKAGSVLEDEDQLGLAHFLEHMAFNGTEHFEKQELFDYMESVGMQTGAHTNAYTSFDETVYMLRVPTDTADVVETAFQVLEDWAHLIVLDSVEIEKERGVVIEEWRLGRGAQARMLDEQFPILFSNSRYAERLPIGKRETVETFDHESLRRFYADWYRPDLMAIVAVGDLEQERIVELITQHFSGLETAANARAREMFDVPDHEETLFAIAVDAEAPNTTVGLYHKQPLREQGSLGAYRQALVEGLYNSMLNARLFELTQQAEAPFLFAFSGQGRFIGATEVYQLFAGVNEDGVATGVEGLLREGERVARHGFNASELERHKIDFLRTLEQAYAERDNTESRTYASEYIRAFLEGEPIPGIETEFALSQALMPTIELEEVNRLAAEWITEQNRVVMVNAPVKPDLHTPTEDELRSAMAAVISTEIDPYEDAVSDEPLVAEVPAPVDIVAEERIEEIDVTVWTLANGVRVLLKPTDYKDDEVLFRSYSPGGTSLSNDEDYVSAFTASDVVGQGGVGAFSLIDLQKVLAGKAVNVNPNISSLYESISGSASPDDIETMFQLVYLYFTEPRKDSTAFLAFRSQVQGFLANRSASPQSAFSDTIQVTMAQGHFRARPVSAELFDEVDLDASFDFYRDRFADASDFTFVFVGTFSLDSIRPLVRTYLGGLPSIDREETWRDVGIDPPEGVIRKAVRKGVEPQSQTQIIFTGPFDYTAENRQVIRSLASTLQTKLREVLREELGGTYGVGVSASYDRFPDQGYGLRITFGSAPERVEELTEVVFREIESFKNPGPDPEDVNAVREIQRRSKETSLRENGYWVTQLQFADQYGTDPRRLISYDLIDGLTAEKIREAAARYFRSDNYVLVSLFPEAPVP